MGVGEGGNIKDDIDSFFMEANGALRLAQTNLKPIGFDEFV